MAVFRIEKTRDYTVMSNHHLRDKSLSLKAKGLLSLMLSLPEEWDYTTKGLARICKDGVDSICAGVRELEEHGYVIRQRVRNPNGQLGAIEYTILEQPRPPEPKPEKPERENPVLDNPEQASPVLGDPEQENPAQLNTKESSKEISLEYLTDEKHYPLGTAGKDLRAPEQDEEYIIQLCGDTVILNNGLLVEALSRLPVWKQEMVYLSYFCRIPQREIGRRYGRSRSAAGYHIRKAVRQLHEEMEGMTHEE